MTELRLIELAVACFAAKNDKSVTDYAKELLQVAETIAASSVCKKD